MSGLKPAREAQLRLARAGGAIFHSSSPTMRPIVWFLRLSPALRRASWHCRYIAVQCKDHHPPSVTLSTDPLVCLFFFPPCFPLFSTDTMSAAGDGRVLVTGASGYIAGHVVRELLEGGHSVRGTVRDATDASKVRRKAAPPFLFCVCMCVYVCVCVCVCVCVRVCAYVFLFLRLSDWPCLLSLLSLFIPPRNGPLSSPLSLSLFLGCCPSLPPPLPVSVCGSVRRALALVLEIPLLCLSP